MRRTSESVVTWRRAQIALLSAQGIDAAADPDAVRDVIHNFNRDGFDGSIRATGVGGRRRSRLPKRQEIKRIALSDPQDATWSLAKLNQPDHATQARRRYIAWRNRNSDDLRLRSLINTANVA